MQCGHQGAQNHSITSEFSKSISSTDKGALAISASSSLTVVSVVVGATVVLVVVGAAVVGVVVGAAVVLVVVGAVVGGTVVVGWVVGATETDCATSGDSADVSAAEPEPHADTRIARQATTKSVIFATNE